VASAAICSVQIGQIAPLLKQLSGQKDKPPLTLAD